MTFYLFCKKNNKQRIRGRIMPNLFWFLNFSNITSFLMCFSLYFSNNEGYTETKKSKKKLTLREILEQSTASFGIRDLRPCSSLQRYQGIHEGSLKDCKRFPKGWGHLKKKMYIEACRCGSLLIWKKKNSLPYYIISGFCDLQVYNISYEKIFSFYSNVIASVMARKKSYFPTIRRTAFFPMEGKQLILVSGFSKNYARGAIWELILVAFERKKFYLLTKEFSHRSSTHPKWWFEDANNDGRWELCISYNLEESKKCASWNEKTKKWRVAHSKEKPSSKKHDFPPCGYR